MGCENKEKMPLEREESYFSAASFLNFLIKYIFLGRTTEKKHRERQVHLPRIKSKSKKKRSRKQEKLTRNDRVNLGSSRLFSSWILKTLVLLCGGRGKGQPRSN